MTTTLAVTLWSLLLLLALGMFVSGCAPSKKPATIYTQWPFDVQEAARRQDETAKALGVSKEFALDLGNKVKMKLVLIPAGTFVMGSPQKELWRSAAESQHEVTITKPFYMGIYPVTQEQYKAVMGENPSWFKGANRPVEQVGWEDAVDFCKKVSGMTGKTVQLPTEAQWEYACRAGTKTPFNTGATIRSDQANYDDEYLYGPGWVQDKTGGHRDQTTQVGSFKPNAWGLYDMHGNVWQHCSDWCGVIPPVPTIDPTGPANCDYDTHVIRGGCWMAFAWTCRSAYREGIPAGGRYTGGGGYFGFRVVVKGDDGKDTGAPAPRAPQANLSAPATPATQASNSGRP